MREPSFNARVFAVAAAGLLVFLVFLVLSPVATPVLWATLLAFLLWPLNARLRRLLGGRTGAAAFVLTGITALGVAVPVALLGSVFVQQTAALAGRLGSALRQAPTAGDLLRVPFAAAIARWLQQFFPSGIGGIRDRALTAVGDALTFLASRLGTGIVGAVGAATSIALAAFVLYFALRDGDRMMLAILRAIPFDTERKERLVSHIGIVTRALVTGTLVTAIVQGSLVGAAFAVLGLPSPVVFGVVAGLVSVLPLGTGLVWIPAAIALAIADRFVAALLLLLWGFLVVSTVDNLIRPRIVSGRADVPTVAVFLGIIGGIASFGLIGVFLGPIVLATAIETARSVAEEPPSAPGGSDSGVFTVNTEDRSIERRQRASGPHDS